MKVTDNRKITIELGGHKHKLTFDEAQELYRELGLIAGIGGPYRMNFGGGIISSTGSNSYVVGERGPELVVPASTLTALTERPDEDDPPMAVAV